MKFSEFKILIAVAGFLLFSSCREWDEPNQEMAGLLTEVARRQYTMTNTFCPEAKLAFFDSVLANTRNPSKAEAAFFYKAQTLLEMGNEQESVRLYEQM